MANPGWMKQPPTPSYYERNQPWQVRHAIRRKTEFMRLEITRTKHTKRLFEAIEAEAKKCAALDVPFIANRYLAKLVDEALAMRRAGKEGREDSGSRQPIPRMDRYHLDGVVGQTAVEAYRNGIIDLDKLAEMFYSTENLRHEILDDYELFTRINQNMIHRVDLRNMLELGRQGK